MNEFLSSVVPEKCQTCPLVMLHAEEINEYQDDMHRITNAAMDPKVDNSIRQLHAIISAHSPDRIPEGLTPEEIAKELRQTSGKIADEIEERMNTIKAEAAKLALGCFGPVTATTEHNRRSFEITICNSGSKPVSPIEPAVVKSQRI